MHSDIPEITSPDKSIRVDVDVSSGSISYSVTFEGKPVLAPSPLGITVDGVDLSSGATPGRVELSSFRETYPTSGPHSTAVNHYNQADIPLRHAPGGGAWTLQFRVFDDAVAYRYVVGGTGRRMIDRESSAWVLPRGCTAWFQDRAGNYEGVYRPAEPAKIRDDRIIGPPITLELPRRAGYACITESDLIDYSDMSLRFERPNVLCVRHARGKGFSHNGEITTPWRVMIISPDLNGLVNSDAVKNLCAPPTGKLARARWIKPGRALWSIFTVGTKTPQVQKQFCRGAGELGFEYLLIDAGWEKWSDKWCDLDEVVRYADARGVDVWVWKHSKHLKDQKERREFFSRVADAGCVGVKIDFFPPATEGVVNYYQSLLDSAAEYQLMVNFHGCNKPTGRARTNPHEMTREAVRGQEHYCSDSPPQHDAALPFTRFVAGAADYTPCIFNPHWLKRSTRARELSKCVIFTSPVTHWFDEPRFYMKSRAADVIRSLPTTWDSTIVLDGSEIGRLAAFARRKGDTWFCGVMNAGEKRDFTIDLDFLQEGRYLAVILTDDVDNLPYLSRSEKTITKGDSLKFTLTPAGGAVVRLSPVKNSNQNPEADR